MTNKIMDLLREAGLVNSSNDKIIFLGVRRMLAALTDLLVAILWAMILGDFFVGILFEVCYSVLRIYVGGFHTKDEKRCKYLTYTSTLISVLVVFVWPFNNIFFMHFLIVGLIAVILSNAPIENENKPLSRNEKKIYYLYCVGICIAELVIYFLLIYKDMILYGRTVCVAVLLVVVGVLSEIISRYYEHKLK